MLLEKNIAAKRLKFTTDAKWGVRFSEMIFIAVGTEPRADGKGALEAMFEVALAIGKFMTHPLVVVNKSTVPLGSHLEIKKIIQQQITRQQSSATVKLVHNPEFLQEGLAVANFLKPQRVIIGAEDEVAGKLVESVYRSLPQLTAPILHMSLEDAELVKHAANSFLALKISFINDIAALCDKTGANIDLVKRGLATDQRIGAHFLNAGIGYGGSCFPKDLAALVHSAKERGLNFALLQAVAAVNQRILVDMADRIIASWPADQPRVLAIWGLAFKPGTDDVREAPALKLVKLLRAEGFRLNLHDPAALAKAKLVLKDQACYFEQRNEALAGAGGLLIATEWEEYRNIDLTEF